MRAPKSLKPTKLLSLAHPGIREVSGKIDPYAAAWDEHNERAAQQTGPLWLALGDSTVQGIGASAHDRGWVGGVYRRLQANSSEPWRLINLSRYGVKCKDVVTEQLPRVNEWGVPDMITCGVGANDVLWSLGTEPALDGIDQLLRALPDKSLVSAVPFKPGNKGDRVNAYLRIQAAHHNIHVVETWPLRHPGNNVSRDGFHPNDVGYESAAHDVWQAMVDFEMIDPASLVHSSGAEPEAEPQPDPA